MGVQVFAGQAIVEFGQFWEQCLAGKLLTYK